MKIDYRTLPVYEHKQRILDAVENNKVVVVQSPTGSGKTTQIPVILYEAGFANGGVIAVTQPRRIAALSVSEFIAGQLGTTYPGLVGYKMRFEDKTDITTRIKIMTDGILLQEMKLDPWMSKYSVVMVDEAHERSLNIDFVMGLLKRVLKERSDFRVVISSATMNAEAFSAYFSDAPIVTIETQTFPVTVIYDPPVLPANTSSDEGCDALLAKVEQGIESALDDGTDGSVLVFLPGERIIKDCIFRLDRSPLSRKIYTLPLYGRLAKEEQERVFDDPPKGLRKVIVSTNIAETSVTISGVTTVIDSGLAKLNFYSPHAFTSSLNEVPVSKASCDQRRGRAGRTCPGTCRRLYTREDYETREMYTTEEIYRTDLSEVVLRMSELGITDFYGFDFISSPGKEGIAGAVNTLNMLGALEEDNTLSSIGLLMVRFPLEPRISRIIVEAMLHAPNVLEEAIVAASFLSANSPFILPPGEEMAAREAHHLFRDKKGDFVSYLKIFSAYSEAAKDASAEDFCNHHYLDSRVMGEIDNIDRQLSEIVSKMGVPILGGGDKDDYLRCVAAGMMQFVCAREGRNHYRSLTAERICIHPGSNMFHEDAQYIVAGEIVRTSRMFAMSVSPLTREILNAIDSTIIEKLEERHKKHIAKEEEKQERIAADAKRHQERLERRAAREALAAQKAERKAAAQEAAKRNILKKAKVSDTVRICGVEFPVDASKGRAMAVIDWDTLKAAVQSDKENNIIRYEKFHKLLRGKIVYPNGQTLMGGERLDLIVSAAKALDLTPLEKIKPLNSCNINMNGGERAQNNESLMEMLPLVMRVIKSDKKGKDNCFIGMYTDSKGLYYFRPSRGFATALSESFASLEALIDDSSSFTDEQKTRIGALYSVLSGFYK